MFRPKKSLGQNFLIDKNIVKKILSIVDLKKKKYHRDWSGNRKFNE